MLSNLFAFTNKRLTDLNILMGQSALAKHIHETTKFIAYGESCARIEDYLRRCMQSGVTQQVKNRLIGLYDQQFVDCLFASAKRVMIGSQTAFVDSCFMQEVIQKAVFDEDHMPELRTKNWWTKEYSVVKMVGKAHEERLEEKYKSKLQKLSLKYNPDSKELVFSMKFKTYKWAVLGGKGGWTEVG